MHIDIRTGLIQGIVYIPSPNYNARPEGTRVNLIVIHNISLPPGEFTNNHINAFFTNTLDFSAHPYFQSLQTLKVSAHCLIDRMGNIIQYVPLTERAWHAGVSTYVGQENCNDYSIGIELEGVDDLPYTKEQYRSLVSLITLLQVAYPNITSDRIVGHNVIAPDRKTDPGPAFDWALLYELLKNKE